MTRMVIDQEVIWLLWGFLSPYDTGIPIYYHTTPKIPGYGKTQGIHVCESLLHQERL